MGTAMAVAMATRLLRMGASPTSSSSSSSPSTWLRLYISMTSPWRGPCFPFVLFYYFTALCYLIQAVYMATCFAQCIIYAYACQMSHMAAHFRPWPHLAAPVTQWLKDFAVARSCSLLLRPSVHRAKLLATNFLSTQKMPAGKMQLKRQHCKLSL